MVTGTWCRCGILVHGVGVGILVHAVGVGILVHGVGVVYWYMV